MEKEIHHLGLRTTRSNVTPLKPWCFDVGQALACLHYLHCLDGYDIELLLSYNEEKQQYSFVLVDFDLCSLLPLELFKEKGFEDRTDKDQSETYLERMVWGLDAVPYFPQKSQEALFEEFEKGYMNIVNLLIKEDPKANTNLHSLASKVLQLYDSD